MILRFSLIFAMIFGPNAFSLTLEDCYQEALKKNETVASQREFIYQAEETHSQAIGSILPTVTYTGQYFWQKSVSTGNNQFSPSYQPLQKITASQPLLQGYREWYGLRAANDLVNQQNFTQKAVELTTFKNVVAAYYTILTAERDLENLKEETKFLTDRIAELNRLHRIGRAQLTDVLLAKTTLAQLAVQAETDKGQIDTARDSFTLLTGLDSKSDLQDDAVNFNPTVEKLEHYMDMINDRPDVKSAKEQSKHAEASIEIARADHLPSISLDYNHYFDRSGITQNVDWDAMLMFTVPIFAGGVTQSKVRQAYSLSRQADLNTSLTNRSAQEEVHSVHDQMMSDLRQRDLNNEAVELSEASFKENQRSFRLGLVTNLDVLTSLTNFIEAKRNFDKNRFAIRADYLRLMAAVGSH